MRHCPLGRGQHGSVGLLIDNGVSLSCVQAPLKGALLPVIEKWLYQTSPIQTYAVINRSTDPSFWPARRDWR